MWEQVLRVNTFRMKGDVEPTSFDLLELSVPEKAYEDTAGLG